MNNKKQIHIVLLGASVGRAWNIPELPLRLNNSEYFFEFIFHGGFDKSEKVLEIVSRTKNRADAVFIKECAAYFPGNMEVYCSLMKKWISQFREHNIIAIPVTVVPVTRLHPLKKYLFDMIRGKYPLKYGNPFQKNKTILAYNDWLKEYSRSLGLPVLDLEAAVRHGEKNRHLRGDLARIDGLHLNKKAYRILDQIVVPTLKKVNWQLT